MPSPDETARLIKSSFAGSLPSQVGKITLGIPVQAPPIAITGTSVLTTTTLTAAAHASRFVVFTSGTSVAVVRHRFKLPAAAAGTSGNTYIISSNINGTPTSNGIVVRPGTTTDRISGTSVVGGAVKGSTRGNRGSYIALVSNGAGSYFVVGNGKSLSGAGSSLIWRGMA